MDSNAQASPGDLLLAVLTTWGQASQRKFREAYQAVAPIHPSAPDTSGVDRAVPVRWARAAASRGLASLGHCALASDGSITVLPAALALLPAAGQPQAVLTGGRTPESIHDLRQAADNVGADVNVESQQHLSPLAPSRVWIRSPTLQALADVADSTGIQMHKRPGAWAVLSAAAETVATVTQRLAWREQPELNWDRRDFDPAHLRFMEPAADADGQWRLSSYIDPTTQQPLHRLTRTRAGGIESADVNVDWGRYIAATRAGRTSHIRYSPRARTAVVAVTMPLPTALAQALALCSGFHARTLTASEPDEPALLAYSGVPPDVWQETVRRLGIPA